MKTETTTRQLQSTRYFCEEEGCRFVTTDERAAAEHPWRAHKSFERRYLDLDPRDELRTDTSFVFLKTEEDFEQFQRLDTSVSRFLGEPWGGPGWYETWTDSVPCGRGCCHDTALFIRRASQTAGALRRVRQEVEEALEMLEGMGVEHVVG